MADVVRYVKTLFGGGRAFVLSAALLSGFGAADAQVLSTVPLGIPGAGMQQRITRPDGSSLTVGTLNDALHLVEWSAEGDTLGTRSVPAQLPIIRSFVPLSTGEILVSGYANALVLDPALDLVGPVGLSGSHVIEFGQDSLLQAKGDSLFLKGPDGEVIW